MNHFSSVKKYYKYPEFIKLMEVLVAEGKTTGPVQSEALIGFTKLNFQRMQRWDKTFKLNAELQERVQKAKPQVWWVLTEAWCGDSAQCLPGIANMAAASDNNIDLRIIMRDANTDIMDHYLTNGTRSIPKLIAMDNEGNELFTWGPRPEAPQKMMVEWKVNPNGKTHDDLERDMHTWYAHDKGQSLQMEFLELLNK